MAVAISANCSKTASSNTNRVDFVLVKVEPGHTPDEILAADAKSTLSQLGLDKHLSPTRKNGLFAMVERIRALARENANIPNVN